MRIEISRSLLSKLLSNVEYVEKFNRYRLYDSEGYCYAELTEDEAFEIGMLNKELKDDVKAVEWRN